MQNNYYYNHCSKHLKIKTSCKISFDMLMGEIVRANFSLAFAILIP